MALTPVALSLGVLKPLFAWLVPDNPAATTARRALQALLLIGIPTAVVWRMRLHERPILYAALTRIIVGGVAILLVAPLLINVLLTPLMGRLIADPAAAKRLVETCMIPGMLMGYALLFRFYERRRISELSRQGCLRDLAFGSSAGVILPALVFLALFAGGYYTVQSVNPPSVLVLALLSMAFVVCQEELFFRGVVYRITEEQLGTHLAMLISALTFGAAHLANENMTLSGLVSACMGGALLGVLFSLTGRLWIPLGFHLAWNLSQVLFGSSVSGVEGLGRFLEGRLEGPAALTGGAFGIEGSFLLLAGLLVLMALVYRQVARRGRIVPGPWRPSAVVGT